MIKIGNCYTCLREWQIDIECSKCTQDIRRDLPGISFPKSFEKYYTPSIPLALALLKEAGAEIYDTFAGQEFRMPSGIVIIIPRKEAK